MSLTLLLGACGSDDDPAVDEPRDLFFTEEEWAQIRQMSPLPDLPLSPTNRFADDPAAARLGQKFFFDPRFSGALSHPDNEGPGGNGQVGERGQVSCASCHQGEVLFTDQRSQPNHVSLGLGWTPRHTQSVIGSASFDFILWDGRADSLWLQAIRPLDNPREQGLTRLGLAHTVFRLYRAEYEGIFGPLPALEDTGRFPLAGGPALPEHGVSAAAAWQNMSEADRDAVNRVAVNFGKAIEAYERLLGFTEAKFDRYVAGQHDLFRESEKRGLRVFLGVGRCIQCHTGPLFTDQKFHNIGVRQAGGENVPAIDEGSSAAMVLLLADPLNGASSFSDDPAAGQRKLDLLVSEGRQAGQFRTPSLRNSQLTAPYFHNGSQTGLTGVIEFYRLGGDLAGTFVGSRDPLILPLPDLIPTDVFDLQEFLWTLTGDPLDSTVTTSPELP